jgi:SpoVK/Ycf46/Vps4 family AAA+-type ATPase
VTAATPAQRRRLAGEVAAELERDLVHIDLRGLTSKFIGETEKNLQALFEDVESTGAVLFFDEADALFGRRGAVKDAHDRYANQEVNYLLARLERSPAVVIFAAAAPARIAPEFQRRLRLAIKLSRSAAQAKTRATTRGRSPLAAR